MKIEHIDAQIAYVSAGSVKSTVSVQLLNKVKKGDYVLVHAGIAIEKINRAHAKEILKLIKELGQKL